MSEEAPEEVIESPKPQQIIESVDYDANNPDHVLRWERAGRPSLDEVDGDGNFWKPTVTSELQEDGTYQAILLVPPEPLTEIEELFKKVQLKLNADEEKRTGKPVNPNGAVPLARAIAATAILGNGWHYPSEADLETPENQLILAAIYADPTMNTHADSPVEQKRKVLHFTLVMLAGQAFGVEYQAELGAYERTASGDFRNKISVDQDPARDWLELTCPKMHKDWPSFATIRQMFLAVMS